MTMAGYMARIGQWNRFDCKWEKGLRKAGLPYFHAKEMPNHPFTLKAPKIADDCLMVGFVVRLDRRDYEEVYRGAPWGGKAQPDSMYGLCFRYLISAALEVGLGEYRPNLQLDFVIESGHAKEGAPNEILRRIKRRNIPSVSEHLGTVTTMDKHECAGLQAADGLATGAAWAEGPDGSSLPLTEVMDAINLSDVYPRSSLKAPLFRCHIGRDELRKFRDDTFALAEFRRQFGQRRHAEIQARKIINDVKIAP